MVSPPSDSGRGEIHRGDCLLGDGWSEAWPPHDQVPS